MTHVRFDYSKAYHFLVNMKLHIYAMLLKLHTILLHEKTGAGSDFLGWIDLPTNYDKEEFSRIQKALKKLKLIQMFLLVIGIGGSYLRSKCCN